MRRGDDVVEACAYGIPVGEPDVCGVRDDGLGVKRKVGAGQLYLAKRVNVVSDEDRGNDDTVKVGYRVRW